MERNERFFKKNSLVEHYGARKFRQVAVYVVHGRNGCCVVQPLRVQVGELSFRKSDWSSFRQQWMPYNARVHCAYLSVYARLALQYGTVQVNEKENKVKDEQKKKKKNKVKDEQKKRKKTK